MRLSKVNKWAFCLLLGLTPKLSTGSVVIVDLNYRGLAYPKEIARDSALGSTEPIRNGIDDMQYKCRKIFKLTHEVGNATVAYPTNLVRCELIHGFYQLPD